MNWYFWDIGLIEMAIFAWVAFRDTCVFSII